MSLRSVNSWRPLAPTTVPAQVLAAMKRPAVVDIYSTPLVATTDSLYAEFRLALAEKPAIPPNRSTKEVSIFGASACVGLMMTLRSNLATESGRNRMAERFSRIQLAPMMRDVVGSGVSQPRM